MKLIINDVIIVEGTHDAQKLQSIVEADILWTNGSAVSRQFLDKIREIAKKREVIVFTDPDYPGQRIRAMIAQAVPSVKHAYINKEDALGKGKVGIEHASNDVLIKALERVKSSSGKEAFSDITKADLYTLGLVGDRNSQKRRELISNYYCIGYNNGNQLLKQLHMFTIMKTDLLAIIKKLKEDEDW